MTDEEPHIVDGWFAKKQPTYPIVILKDKTFEKALGVKFFPTGAVMDPEGKLTYAGSAGSAEKPLKAALKESDKGPLFPKQLAKARKCLGEQEFDDAYAEVMKLDEKGEAELEEWVASFRSHLETRAAEEFARAQEADESGVVFSAVQLATAVAEAEPAYPCSGAAAEWLTELQGRPGHEAEMKAGPAYTKAQDLESEGEYTKAVKAYVALSKKHGDTRLAEVAMTRAIELVDDGRPGYERSCSKCKRAKRACSKHAETVKI